VPGPTVPGLLRWDSQRADQARMILIEMCVDLEDASYRVILDCSFQLGAPGLRPTPQ
jgi:hypothetical protein